MCSRKFKKLHTISVMQSWQNTNMLACTCFLTVEFWWHQRHILLINVLLFQVRDEWWERSENDDDRVRNIWRDDTNKISLQNPACSGCWVVFVGKQRKQKFDQQYSQFFLIDKVKQTKKLSCSLLFDIWSILTLLLRYYTSIFDRPSFHLIFLCNLHFWSPHCCQHV